MPRVERHAKTPEWVLDEFFGLSTDGKEKKACRATAVKTQKGHIMVIPSMGRLKQGTGGDSGAKAEFENVLEWTEGGQVRRHYWWPDNAHALGQALIDAAMAAKEMSGQTAQKAVDEVALDDDEIPF